MPRGGRAGVASVSGATGQRCLAGSIIVGVGDAYGPVRERVLDAAASLRIGYGLEGGVDMGPVISGPHRDRIAGYVGQGEKEGARVALDGRRSRVPDYPGGHRLGAAA